MVLDNISDCIIRIKNAFLANNKQTFVYNNKIVMTLLSIFKKKGYIKDYFLANKKYICVIIKDAPQINGPKNIIRISKPGCKIYSKYNKYNKIIESLDFKNGFLIVSTSLGAMTHIDATKLQLGGEIFCYLY